MANMNKMRASSSNNVKSSDDSEDITQNVQMFYKTSDEIYRNILEQHTMVDILDIEETLTQYEKAKIQLHKKQVELNIIETLAFYGDEPAIVSLRKQLFSVVKLTYSDFIANQLQKHLEEIANFSDAKTKVIGYSVDRSEDIDTKIQKSLRHRFIDSLTTLFDNCTNKISSGWQHLAYLRNNRRDYQKQWSQQIKRKNNV
jgi:tyrosyl-tRNA synthetase